MSRTPSKTISIAEDFSRYPAGRIPVDGDWSGERFREEYLVPALRDFDRVTVVFNGIAGVASSFLDEAFGGLVRECGMDEADLKGRLTLRTDEGYEDFARLAWYHIEWASRALSGA